jgi:galactokinase
VADPTRTTHAIDEFRRLFGRDAEVVATAPGRVNLIGEHTDYNGGAVLPMAIDRHAVAAAARADRAGGVRVAALDLGETVMGDPRDAVGPTLQPAWGRYPLGVAHTLAAMGVDVPPADLVMTSSVPVGAGLSSSAAIEVATATALLALAGEHLDPVETARLCQHAEHTASGVPCGIMDMLAATAGRAGAALLIDCATLAIETVPLPPDDACVWLVADTGVPRALAETAYAARRATCEAAAAALGVSALCAADPSRLETAGLSTTEMRRARHVLLEDARTRRAADRLRAGDVATFGALMLESHASLRDLYEVSCPELDTVVDAAAAARGAGVHGARMTGAGFGGCAIVLTERPAAAAVTDRLQRAFEQCHGRPLTVYEVRAAGPAAAHRPKRDRSP